MEKIGAGRTAEIFLTENNTALKLFYNHIHHDAVRYEYTITKKISNQCTLVPKVYDLVKKSGRMGIEYEFVNGYRLVDLISSNPLRAKHYARLMADLHRMIHTFPGNGLRSALELYKDRINLYPQISPGIRTLLLQFLEQAKSSALCHGDFHVENIITAAAGNSKVLDWICAFSGEPLADVARTRYIMLSGRSPEKKPFITWIVEFVFRRIIVSEYIKHYFREKILPRKKLAMWDIIIRIDRYYENIPEEKEHLKQTIRKAIKKVVATRRAF